MEKFAVIDLETTGHAAHDKIIDVGIVIIEEDKITTKYSTLLDPDMEIPPFISNLTGIHNEDVVDMPKFNQKAKEIIRFFNNSYLVAHNVSFDLGFLNRELHDNGYSPLNNSVLDTVELARILYPRAPGFKLSQLAEYLQIEHKDPHRALSDAYVTARILLMMKKKLRKLPYETIVQLLKIEPVLHSDLSLLLHKFQKEIMFSTEEKTSIDTYNGLAFKRISYPSVKNQNTSLPSFGDYLDDIYGPGGKMSIEMTKYERREGQREMSEHIFDAFQVKKHALIEAGTGTGKSLAYLIPAIYEALKKDERIVVSTYTTQLQTQLLEEEIPLIQKLINIPFKAVLLKGKNHYISLEKFARKLTSVQKDNYDIALTKAMMLVWITETTTGDIDEIQLPSSGYYFFKGISTDSEGYIDPQSPWFSRSYYQKVRTEAEQANIIITNHSLLCIDMFNDYKFLPVYQKAIIDEAHHLETTATKHYGLKLDYVTMQYKLNQMGMSDENQWFGGILLSYPAAKKRLSPYKWNKIFQDTKYEVDELFRAIFQYIYRQKRSTKSLSDVGRILYRFDMEKEHLPAWQIIKDIAARLVLYLRDLMDILSNLDRTLEEKGTVTKYDRDDLNGHLQGLREFVNHIEQFLIINHHKVKQIKWIEAETYQDVYLCSEPAEISNIIAENFFDKKESIIMTSATLTMKDSFKFICNQLGISSHEIYTHQMCSSFSYTDQVQLMVPNDFPDINDEDFIYSTCEAILSLAQVTKGRMLILFTSYDMLRKAYHILKETINLDEYMLLAQGISSGSRSRLKKNFQNFDQTILLGTSSFWEGVDIPGDDLSCLIIVRLPFQPPNHPVYEAKSAALKAQGKNPFFELSLPHAVIRFKQGFGRLIRSANDRGIVFVCDARIIKSHYGSFFSKSIPNVPIQYDSTYELIRKAEEWF